MTPTVTNMGLTLPAAIELLQAVCVLLAGAVVYLWWFARECRCEKCAFHQNEARVKRLARKELAHDTEHKGFGFKPGTKDYLPCNDDACSRNPILPGDRGTLDD